MSHHSRFSFWTLLLSVLLAFGALPAFASNTATATTDLAVLSQLQAQQKTQATTQAQAQSESPSTLKTSSAPAIAHDKLTLNSPIIDEALILTTSEKAHLEAQLRKLYDDKLAQMAIVIVPTTNGVDIFDYAYQVAKRWQLGDKDRDNGILMAVAINDRTLHIVTGYGVEGVLPDVIIKRIIREDITPSFKTGAYAQGLSAGIARIDERLRADPETLAKADQAHAEQESPVDIITLFLPAFVLGAILIPLFGQLMSANIATGGFAIVALVMGASLFGVVVGSVVLWLILLLFCHPDVLMAGNGHLKSSGSHRVGGGGGASGGFGRGGFGGGGGSFGGGGAGGSW